MRGVRFSVWMKQLCVGCLDTDLGKSSEIVKKKNHSVLHDDDAAGGGGPGAWHTGMIWVFIFQNCKSTIKCRKMSRLLVYTARTIVVWGNVPTLSKSHFPLSKVQLPEKKEGGRKRWEIETCLVLVVLLTRPNARPAAR